MEKIDKRLRSSTFSFNNVLACVLICDEDHDICWQGNQIEDEQLVEKVLELHFTTQMRLKTLIKARDNKERSTMTDLRDIPKLSQ